MLKVLKNKNGFGLIGIIIAITVLIIMTASILPTFTARMNYKQAKYTVGVVRTIENAENAYMAKNGSFAPLTTLSANGYLSSTFLQSVQGGNYPQPNWVSAQIANQTVNVCVDNYSGCLNNPGVGANGYFVGIYNIPTKFQTYIEREIPGSGAVGTQDVSYVAPVPSAPPVANAQNANYANSAGNANYANTAGYANSSGLPAWSQEANALVGQYVDTFPYNTNTGVWGTNINHTNAILLVTGCFGTGVVFPGGIFPHCYDQVYVNSGRGFYKTIPDYSPDLVLSAFSG